MPTPPRHATARTDPEASREQLTLELDSAPGHLVRRAQQVHTAIWATELDGHLTGPQYALVSALRAAGEMDQRSAGATASLDKSTTADVIARLERNGWVSRTRDPLDGRRKLLTLTRAATAALNDVTPRVETVQQMLLSSLPARERDAFVQSLAQVAYVGSPPAESRSDPTVVALSTAPGHLLRRSEQVHHALWASHVGLDLTPAQYALLCAVASREGLDQSTAGELASLDKSSVAEVVSRLRRREWLTSEPDRRDRRRKRLHLASGAVAMLETVTPHVATVQRELLAPLTQPDQRRLVTQLQRIGYPRDVA